MTESLQEKVETELEDRITVKIGEDEKSFFMSYALLNRLTKLVGAQDDVAGMFLSPDLQTSLLSIIFAGKGDPDKLDLDEIELTKEVANTLVEWAGGHILDFFLKGIEAAGVLTKKNEDRLKNLMPSLTGLEASAEAMQSAGPSE